MIEAETLAHLERATESLAGTARNHSWGCGRRERSWTTPKPARGLLGHDGLTGVRATSFRVVKPSEKLDRT